MQFHRCNARVITFKDRDEGVKIIQFTSYQTAVCRLYYDVESNELLQVDFGRCSKYSPTTIRQVYRFLREYLADCPDLEVVVECFRDLEKNRNIPFRFILEGTVYIPDPPIGWDIFSDIK